jgi:hypothetical protein
MKAKHTLSVLLGMLILQGCEAQRTQTQRTNPTLDFAAQAEQDFPRYKIEKKEFYGFRLTEPIDIRTFDIISPPETKDKNTEGDIYTVKDINNNFDRIRITLNNGLLSKIQLMKFFNNYLEADNFARVVYQKSKETYPQECFEYNKNAENNNYSFAIYFSNDKEKWKSSYIHYMDFKKVPSSKIKPPLFHEFLSYFGITLQEIRSLWAVVVEYETKIYVQAEHDMREKLKKQLKGL